MLGHWSLLCLLPLCHKDVLNHNRPQISRATQNQILPSRSNVHSSLHVRWYRAQRSQSKEGVKVRSGAEEGLMSRKKQPSLSGWVISVCVTILPVLNILKLQFPLEIKAYFNVIFRILSELKKLCLYKETRTKRFNLLFCH